MKRFSKFLVIMIISGLLVSSVWSHEKKIRTTGIGLRGSSWKNSHPVSELSVFRNDADSEIQLSDDGGWICFLSRINDNWFGELGLGSLGKVEARSDYLNDADVHISAVHPLTFGLRYELFSLDNRSAFQPYISGGAGPYWISDIYAKEDHFEEEEQVSAKTDLLKGGYAGAGLNFALTSWLNLGFDARYHFVDFDKKHERSGWEYGFGITFMWGHYHPN